MKTYKGMEYITLEEMADYGYSPEPYPECPELRMIPLTQEQVRTLWKNDCGDLFVLYPNDTEGTLDTDKAFDEVANSGFMFGAELEVETDWLEWLFENLTK